MLFLVLLILLIWGLILAFLIRKESSHFKTLSAQSGQLLRTQEGSQGVTIGYHGASSLFIKLMEAGGRYQIADIGISAHGEPHLERTFPLGSQFRISERIGFNPRVKTQLTNADLYVTGAVSIHVLVEMLLVSLGSTLFIVGLGGLIHWFNRNQLLLATARSREQIAKQVAHDIRSPLSAINLIAGQMNGVQQQQKELLLTAVGRINDIATDLLNKSRHRPAETPAVNPRREQIQFESVLMSLLDEKRAEYSNHPDISFVLDMPYTEPTLIVASRKELSRVLSNLLNNAVEAMQGKADCITVSVRRHARSLEVNIVDKGCGIPDTVLERLGKEELSFGKGRSGNGIGLFNARRYVESVGGSLTITSRVNRGTMVCLCFRRALAS